MAKLIEFEGVDGSGKSTMVKYFIDQLRPRGYKVLETREVGNPHLSVCVKLRELVLSPDSDLDGSEMEMIFAAMRLRNHRMYRQINKEYDFIVSDRGYLSHTSYTDHNVNEEFTNSLYLNFIQNITKMPDAVLYFDVNTETALKRRVKRGEGMDVIEMKGVEFQEKVRESFLEHIANLKYQSPNTEVFMVDANKSIVEVQKRVDKIVSALILE
jgi:dTMP kinase